jgi:hypothetical protein
MLENASHPGNLASAALLNARHPTISLGCGLTEAQVFALWDDFLYGRITAGDLKDFLGAAFNGVA